MRSLRVIVSAVMVLLPLMFVNGLYLLEKAEAQGACAIWRTYVTGDSLSASELNSLQTTLGQTNMITTCIDDDSVNVGTMQATTDPYPADTASLATTLQGELRRVRYVLKTLTGWSQWYTHSEAFVFPNAVRFSLVGPHAIGGTVSADVGLLVTGTGAAGQAMGMQINSTTTPATTESSYGLNVTPTLTEFSSGLHPVLAGLNVAPTVTAGAGTLTTLAAIRTGALTAQTGTTNAAAIYVSAAPTGATNNYALWAAAGTTRLGTPSSATGLLELAHASSALITGLQAGNATEANTYVWPVDSGTSGQVLQTDGATPTTTLSWLTLAVAVAATQAEMEAASSTTVAVTPGRTQYHPGVAKSWGKFAVDGTISASYNLTSVTDNGAGSWTANLTTGFSTANRAVVATALSTTAIIVTESTTPTATTIELRSFNDAGTATDPTNNIQFAGYGDQ